MENEIIQIKIKMLNYKIHIASNAKKITPMKIEMLNYKIQIALMKTFGNENHSANLIPMIGMNYRNCF